MSEFPDTTAKVTAIEPCGDNKVCITMEMVVDVHRLAEIGSDMLRSAMAQLSENTRLTESVRK